MLTLDNVLKLAEMGFTKDEIMQFNGETPAALAGEVNTAEETPAPAPVPAEPVPAVVDTNAELVAAIQDLKKTIQASNIATTPQPVQESIQDKADDVLMKLINM